MSESFYFIEANMNESNLKVIEKVKQFSINNQKPIYLIDSSLVSSLVNMIIPT